MDSQDPPKQPGSEEEVDIIELMIEKRKDMECRQELDRVGRLSKVSRTLHHPLGTKLARNILTKITAGPLGTKHLTPPPEATPTTPEERENRHTRRSSEEVRYQQRLAHMHAMKETQNEELDTLRSRGIVQSRLADRRMRSRARRMFNQRIFVKPKSEKTAGKSSILVTGIEREEEGKSVEFIRQESQMYVGNFLKMPSKGRRVLQRLNSNQLNGIKSTEMRKSNLRMFQHLPFDRGDGELSFEMLRNRQEGANVISHQEELAVSPNSHRKDSSRPASGTSGRDLTETRISKRERLKSKFHSGLKKIPTVATKFLSLKKNGRINKSPKKSKLKKSRHVSSSLDELAEDVRVKPRKKKLMGKKKISSKEVMSKALEDEQTSNIVSHRHLHIRHAPPPPPSSSAACPTSPVGISNNWPPLSPSASHDIPTKSHDASTRPHVMPQKSYSITVRSQNSTTNDITTVSPDPVVGSHDYPSPTPPFDQPETASGPPYPVRLSSEGSSLRDDSIDDDDFCVRSHSTKTLSNGEQEKNGVTDSYFSSELHDNHMISSSPPVMTSLREIEQTENDGYVSDSESGYSDIGMDRDRAPNRIVCTEARIGSRVCEDGSGSVREKSPFEEEDEEKQRDELGDHVADLPASSSKEKRRSRSEESSPSVVPTYYKRHFSTPQIVREVDVLPPVMLYDQPTQHGHYTPATVEIDPFALDFQQGVEENLSLTQGELSTLVTTTSQQVSVSTGPPTGDPPLTLETVETRTHVTYTHTTCKGNRGCQVLEPEPGLLPDSGSNPLTDPEHQIPAHAFQDPRFLQFIKALNRDPTNSDYICYKLRNIGDEIDQKYDDKLNHALDAIYMEAFKSSLSWETFSSISKRLLIEGQKIQDGIMLINCFGRRLAEMVPTAGDTVAGFTQQVVDTYASDLLLSIGGWGRLVESYNQVEATPQEYEFDYEDYQEHGLPYLNIYGEVPEDPHIPDPQPLNTTDAPPPNSHPTIIQVNPPPVCLHEPQASFEPPPLTHRLRRVVSVEVLFMESDPTEHAQENHHDNTSRQRSLNRSVSTSSIEVTSTLYQNHFFHSNHLSPSPTKPVSERFHFEATRFEKSTYRHSRGGSVASLCSVNSAIRLVGDDVHGDERPVIVSKGSNQQPDLTDDPPYLDLHLDTPTHSRKRTLGYPGNSSSDSDKGQPTTTTRRRSSSLLLAVAVAAGLAGVLGIVYLRQK